MGKSIRHATTSNYSKSYPQQFKHSISNWENNSIHKNGKSPFHKNADSWGLYSWTNIIKLSKQLNNTCYNNPITTSNAHNQSHDKLASGEKLHTDN